MELISSKAPVWSHTRFVPVSLYYNLLSTVVSSLIIWIILCGSPPIASEVVLVSSFSLATAAWLHSVEPKLQKCVCSHRNIRLLGDGLIAFSFSVFIFHFHSDLL